MKTCKLYHRLILLASSLFLLASCDGGNSGAITTPVRIVAFGDSLTAGYNLSIEESFPAQLQRRFLQDGSTGVAIINQGISGDTTQDGLARLNKVLEANPDIVILELGANDILRSAPAAKARTNLSRIIVELKKRDIAVLLTGIKVRGVFALGNQSYVEYKTLFRDIAKEYELPFYEDFLDGVIGRKNLNLSDGLHPNAKGIAVIVEGIYPQVAKLAAEAASRKARK